MVLTALNKLIHELEDLLLKAELHKRFNMTIIPVHIEKRLNILHPNKIRYQ
jgi:hypothetical protein